MPYQLVGQRTDVRASATTVEVLSAGGGWRAISEARKPATTRPSLRTCPSRTAAISEWSPGRIVRWASGTGPATAALVAAIMASRPHPEQGFRSCLGIMRLGRRYGDERLEAAAARALAIRALSYRSVESILRTGSTACPCPTPPAGHRPADHDNVRGADYYE